MRPVDPPSIGGAAPEPRLVSSIPKRGARPVDWPWAIKAKCWARDAGFMITDEQADAFGLMAFDARAQGYAAGVEDYPNQPGHEAEFNRLQAIKARAEGKAGYGIRAPVDSYLLNAWLDRGYGNRQAKILTEEGEGWTNFSVTVAWRTSSEAEYLFASGSGGSIEDAFVAAKRDPFAGVPE